MWFSSRPGSCTPRPEQADEACHALSRQGSPQATRSGGLDTPAGVGLLAFRGAPEPDR